MDDTQDILDAPLETRPTNRPSNFAILTSKFDFGINVMFMAAWVFTGLGALLQNDLIFLLIATHFFMGCYQFGSTLVGAIRGQKPKRYYLVGVIAYFFFLAFIFLLESKSSAGEEVIYLFVGFIPFFGAAYYTKLCYDTKQKLQAYD